MDFELSEQQQAFKQAAERFAAERLVPHYLRRAREPVLDREVIREMGALGLIGVDLPQAHGGLGADGVTAGVIIEAIAYADVNLSYVQLLASLMGLLIERHGDAAMVERWLPAITRGETLVGLALTEPRGGSDAANLVLSARKQGNGYRLSGEKTSISLSDQADAAVVFARTGAQADGARGVSAFLVELDQPGIMRSRLDDVGSLPVGRGSLFFDDVFVPADSMLGEENSGFTQVMAGFDYSRALIGLECLAPAQASLDETWRYVQEREAFGRPIAQFQGVSFPLAEAETQLTMMRLLCYRTLALRDRAAPHTAEAAMCKWYVPKTSCEIIHQCLLTHGHFAYTHGLPHHQRYTDVMGLQIGDGTAQIQKLVIAREKIGRIAVQHADRGTSA